MHERKYYWGTYSLYISGFVNYGIPLDMMLWRNWLRVTANYERRGSCIGWFLLWWLFTKMVKRMQLFRRNWRDIIFLPIAIIWRWCHDFIKLYALMTLSHVGPVTVELL